MARQRRTNVRIPEWVLYEAAVTYKLSSAEAYVLIMYASAVRDGVGYLSDGMLQDLSGISRPTIRRARPKLIKLGLIEVVVEASPGRVMRYRIPERMPVPIPISLLPRNHMRAEHDGSGWKAVI